MHAGDTLAGRYLLIRELGRGGMGAVFEARDSVLDRDVAIKTIPVQSASEAAYGRLRREARIVARMDHPCVVPVYDLLEHESGLCLIMPVLRGMTLREMLKSGPLTAPFTATMALQIARALQYSHQHKVVHRDIKPANIMIMGESQGTLSVKVMDFGVALSASDADDFQPGGVVGTVDYLSPEQVRCVPVDHRTDIYSLGVLLYECLVGRPPFTGNMMDVMHSIMYQEPRRLRDRDPAIPDVFDELIARCLRKEPDARPSLRSVIKRLGKVPMATLVTRTPSASRSSQAINSAPQQDNIGNEATVFINPLTGRRDELFILSNSLNKAKRGQLQLCLIAGEPGMGKSRVLFEVARFAESRAVPMYWGRCMRGDSALPYHALCEVIRDYCERSPLAGGGIEVLRDLAPELVSRLPVLADIPALRTLADKELTRRTGPKALVSHSGAPDVTMLELIARALMVMGQGRPMIMALDDLHNADLSADALVYLFRRLATTPTLLLASYRPQTAGRIQAVCDTLDAADIGDRFRHIKLAPLDGASHSELLNMLIDGGHFDESASERLFAATGGNPLAAQELLAGLRTIDGLRVRDGSWTLVTGSLPDGQLPASLAAIVRLRVYQLNPELRTFLTKLTIFDHYIHARDLSTVFTRQQLDRLLPAALDSGFLTTGYGADTVNTASASFTFANQVVRDLLLAELTGDERRALFRSYAQGLLTRAQSEARTDDGTIDTKTGPAVDQRLAHRLARAFRGAEMHEQALRYGLTSARHALSANGPEYAIAILGALLPAPAVLPDDEDVEEAVEEDDGGGTSVTVLECEARMLLGTANRKLGDMDAARDQAERAYRGYLHLDDARGRIQALVALAAVSWYERRQRDALDSVELALVALSELARDERDTLADELVELAQVGRQAAASVGAHKFEERICTALGDLAASDPADNAGGAGDNSADPSRQAKGQHLLVLGEYQAAVAELAGLASQGNTIDAHVLHTTRIRLARVAIQLGHYDEVVAQCRLARTTLGEEQLLLEAELLALQGRACISLGHFEEANHLVCAGLACVAMYPGEDTQARNRCLIELLRDQGNILFGRGRPGEALSAFKRGLSLCVPDSYEQSVALFNAGYSCVLAGRYQRANDYLTRSEARKLALEDYWGQAYTYAAWTVVQLDCGELERARQYAAQGLQLGLDVGDPKLIALLRHTSGRVTYLLGDLQRAEHQLQLGLRDANEYRAQPEATLLHLALARVQFALDQRELAETHAQQGFDSAYRDGSPIEQGEAQLLLARLRIVRGDLSVAAEHLEQARALVEWVGNPYRILDVELALIELAIERGQCDDAQTRLDRAHERALALEARVHAATTWRLRSRLHKQQGAIGEAERAQRRADGDMQALSLSALAVL